jgi:uncharacterized protein YkwD
LIALVGMFAFALARPGLDEAAAACPNEDALPSQISSAEAAAAVICLSNEERTSRGLRPLKSNGALANAGDAHTKFMIDKGCFSHQCPAEKDFVSRIFDTAYLPCKRCRWGLGENLAWGALVVGTPRAIVDAWMDSEPHRVNLLNKKFRNVGMGVRPGSPTAAQVPGSMTYTADYGYRKKKKRR